MSAIVGGALGARGRRPDAAARRGLGSARAGRLEHEGPDAGGQDGVRAAVRLAARHHRHRSSTPTAAPAPSCCRCELLDVPDGLRRPAAAVVRRPGGPRAGACRSWRTSPGGAASRPSGSTTVAEHYLHFGGVSPINGINRALIDADRGGAGRRGMDLPVYFGNRNWEPVRRGHRCADARQRDSARGGVLDVGLGRLLRLHAVPGGHRAGPSRGRARGARADQAAAVLRPSAAGRDVRRRHRATRPRRCPTTCARGPAGVHRALDPAARRLAVRARPLRAPGRLHLRAGGRRGGLSAITTRCGSRGPVRRRCRGWNPMSAITCASLARARYRGGDRLPGRLRRRPHRGGVGSRQRTRRRRPRTPGSRSRGQSTPNAQPRFAELVVDLIDELRLGPSRRARVGGAERCRVTAAASTAHCALRACCAAGKR